MVISAWGLELHVTQERVIVIGELEQRDVSCALEQRFKHGQQADNDNAGQDSGTQASSHLRKQNIQRCLIREADQRGKSRDGEAAHSRCPYEPSAPTRVASKENGDE